MELLEERIQSDGKVAPGNVLKVDSFLNHQMDPQLFNEMAKEWYRLFGHKKINKILTIESSGIGMASLAGLYFNVPVIFAKKSKSINIEGEVYKAEVESFTHKNTNTVIVSKDFINDGDRVLLIDDFLAEGSAMLGLIQICQEAGAEIEGIGIAIEKGFQKGGERLRERNLPLRSLAIVESMDPETGTVYFRENDITPVD